MDTQSFALIGAAGFVAPRHMKAIKDTGHRLIAALDPNDSVGVIDSYFPSADFFTEFERFDRHIDKLRRKGEPIGYVSICSPNDLHDAHIRLALRNQAHAICEKPLVLNPWNIDGLEEIESETGGKIHNILQRRRHPSIIALRDRIRCRQGLPLRRHSCATPVSGASPAATCLSSHWHLGCGHAKNCGKSPISSLIPWVIRLPMDHEPQAPAQSVTGHDNPGKTSPIDPIDG